MFLLFSNNQFWTCFYYFPMQCWHHFPLLSSAVKAFNSNTHSRRKLESLLALLSVSLLQIFPTSPLGKLKVGEGKLVLDRPYTIQLNILCTVFLDIPKLCNWRTHQNNQFTLYQIRHYIVDGRSKEDFTIRL